MTAMPIPMPMVMVVVAAAEAAAVGCRFCGGTHKARYVTDCIHYCKGTHWNTHHKDGAVVYMQKARFTAAVGLACSFSQRRSGGQGFFSFLPSVRFVFIFDRDTYTHRPLLACQSACIYVFFMYVRCFEFARIASFHRRRARRLYLPPGGRCSRRNRCPSQQ